MHSLYFYFSSSLPSLIIAFVIILRMPSSISDVLSNMSGKYSAVRWIYLSVSYTFL